jgi:hypothetical protein
VAEYEAQQVERIKNELYESIAQQISDFILGPFKKAELIDKVQAFCREYYGYELVNPRFEGNAIVANEIRFLRTPQIVEVTFKLEGKDETN